MPVSREPQRPRSDIALVLSRGFGGMNVALVVRAARRRHRRMSPGPKPVCPARASTPSRSPAWRDCSWRRTPEDLRRLFTEAELQDAGAGPAARRQARRPVRRQGSLLQAVPARNGARDDWTGRFWHPARRLRRALCGTEPGGADAFWTAIASPASAFRSPTPKPAPRPLPGPSRGRSRCRGLAKCLYHLLPFRRKVVLGNLRRVFGEVLPEAEIRRLAQAYCAHFARFLLEFVRLPLMSPERRKAWVRVENMEAPIRAHGQGKGLLLLTGHFGNWEVATVAGMGQFPQYRRLFHFVRRPLKPAWLNDFVTRRFQRSGFGTLAKRGSLDAILELLAGGAILVYVLDQHAGGSEGITGGFPGPPGQHLQEPGRARVEHRRAGHPGLLLARARRHARAAFRGTAAAHRVRRHRRSHPAKHPELTTRPSNGCCFATRSSGSGCTGAGRPAAHPASRTTDAAEKLQPGVECVWNPAFDPVNNPLIAQLPLVFSGQASSPD